DHVDALARLFAPASGVTCSTNVPSFLICRTKSALSSYRTSSTWLKAPRHTPARSFVAYGADTCATGALDRKPEHPPRANRAKPTASVETNATRRHCSCRPSRSLPVQSNTLDVMVNSPC